VVIVDDGSTDGTENLVCEKYPEITYLKQNNLGVSAARNAGIAATSDEWLAFLDSDDEWLPEKLQCQMDALEAEPEMMVCHTDEIWIRNGKHVNPMKKHNKHGGWIFDKCLPLCCISPSSVIIHRSVLDEIGFFDQSLPACEDYDLWLRVASSYPVLYISEKLVVKHGGHQDQLSEKYWGMDRFRIQALEKIILSGNLIDENLNNAKQMLREKTIIFSTGARKRGRTAEAEKCEQRMEAILG
jgi:glycosyltransferase involved in cell wall biosynthesis